MMISAQGYGFIVATARTPCKDVVRSYVARTGTIFAQAGERFDVLKIGLVYFSAGLRLWVHLE
jgi:hypothetical protein